MNDDQIAQATIGEPTVLNGQITLVEYDPEWPKQFERERIRISGALGDRVLLIEHVGSTSVPGLIAKPSIDILLVVANSADESGYVSAMENAGYALRIREPNWHEHRMFKGPDVEIKVHVFSEGSSEIERMLVFRDRLREDAADRELYARTKRALAEQIWKHGQNYADAKTEVVQEILSRAYPRLTRAVYTLRSR